MAAPEYYHQEHLGNTRLKTNSNGQTIFDRNYKPFGLDYGGSGSEEFKYTRKYIDASGLYYFGARYYDPDIGRFITEDLVLGSLEDPQGLNRYVYCRNNPHKYIDLDGRVVVAAIPVVWLIVPIVLYGVVTITPIIIQQLGAISSTIFRPPHVQDQLGYIENINNYPNTITLQDDKNKAYWRKKDLRRHQEEHADEMGLTPEQYEKESLDFMNNPLDDDSWEYMRVNEDTVRYNEATNRFAVKRYDNSMKTYFSPNDRIDYWWRDFTLWDAIERNPND